jgi:hypothetical protein
MLETKEKRGYYIPAIVEIFNGEETISKCDWKLREA